MAQSRRGERVAVVGAGVFGAWTAHHLQQQGHRVTLIDAHGPAHSRASDRVTILQQLRRESDRAWFVPFRRLPNWA